MRLVKLKIKNFRCFGPEETIITFEDFTSFIGANSSGKTSAIKALLKVFGDVNSEREITRADFHVPSNIKPDQIEENHFSIELVFDFKEAGQGQSASVPVYFEHFVVEGPGKVPTLRILLEANWKKSNSPEGSIDYKIWYIDAPEPDVPNDENKVPISKHDLNHIKVIYVPALRNPSNQLRNAAGTILWRVLKGINWTDDYIEKLSGKIEEVNNFFNQHKAINELKKSIKSQWNKYHKDIRYKEANIKFSNSDMESILKKVEVEFSPTETPNSYNIDSLGDGLKSLFYLSLVSTLLEIEDFAIRDQMQKAEEEQHEPIFSIEPVALTIVAVEEPENHISPQILGRVIGNLRDICKRSNAQTIITSHTPAILKRIEPKEIRHFRVCKDNLQTIVKQIKLPDEKDEAYKYVKEAVKAYPEIYFSRLVLLGEGDSEEIILPRIVEALGHTLDSSGISVVPLGGRHVNHFWRLLNELQIPFLTLLDLDRERSGGGWGRIKYALKELIKLGYDRNVILQTSEGVLTDEQLEEMHEWDPQNIHLMEEWISLVLNPYGVYFSSPLDLDFLMLESFTEQYLSIIRGSEGPFIKDYGKIKDMSDDQKRTEEYKTRLMQDIRATLKPEGGDGSTYSKTQKELMIWYTYFFLNRGKPTTHILALSNIDMDTFNANLPEPLRRLQTAIKDKLESDPFSSVGDENNE